jgi:membrane fusion protein (multidrug efflux system)
LKKKIIIGLVLILVVVFFIFKSGKPVKPAAKAEDMVFLNTSDVSVVKLGKVDDILAFTGDLSALNQAVISSEVDAVVKKVLVQEGQLVTKGQTLAVLDDTNVVQEVSQQQALLSSAKARFELDKKKLEKQKALYDEGFISKIAYDELQTNYQASLELIKQQQALLAQSQKRLSDTIIKAPFSGYLYQKNIDNGQLATKNGKLFAIASLDNLQIKAAIPSDYINHIKINQQVSFNVETSHETYFGKVLRINPVAELGTRSYYIYIDFDNKTAKLKSGQFVKGRIILSSLANITYVSRDAIRKTENETYVLVLENNRVIKKPVKILLSNKFANINAISGVKDGDSVLLANVLSIKAGDHAKIVN